jgi:hypothetical protein
MADAGHAPNLVSQAATARFLATMAGETWPPVPASGAD